MEYYTARKNPANCNNIVLRALCEGKFQTEKDKYYIISVICEVLETKQKPHRYREQIDGC